MALFLAINTSSISLLPPRRDGDPRAPARRPPPRSGPHAARHQRLAGRRGQGGLPAAPAPSVFRAPRSRGGPAAPARRPQTGRTRRPSGARRAGAGASSLAGASASALAIALASRRRSARARSRSRSRSTTSRARGSSCRSSSRSSRWLGRRARSTRSTGPAREALEVAMRIVPFLVMILSRSRCSGLRARSRADRRARPITGRPGSRPKRCRWCCCGRSRDPARSR